MWLIVFQFTRWLYRTLNADVRPWQIALGITLGALAGLLPLGLGTLVVFTLLLILNVHFGSATFSFGLFRLLGWALQAPLIRPIGWAAFDYTPQQPLISLAQTPVLSWLRMDHEDVMGALVLWLFIAIPLFLAVSFMWSRFQDKLRQRWRQSPLLKCLSKLWLVKAIRYVFIGAT